MMERRRDFMVAFGFSSRYDSNILLDEEWKQQSKKRGTQTLILLQSEGFYIIEIQNGESPLSNVKSPLSPVPVQSDPQFVVHQILIWLVYYELGDN
jgi:hypothetical protein